MKLADDGRIDLRSGAPAARGAAKRPRPRFSEATSMPDRLAGGYLRRGARYSWRATTLRTTAHASCDSAGGRVGPLEAKEVPVRIEREEETGMLLARGDLAGPSSPVPCDLERVDPVPSGTLLDPADQAAVLNLAKVAAEEHSLSIDLRPEVSPGGVADRATVVVTLQTAPPVPVVR